MQSAKLAAVLGAVTDELYSAKLLRYVSIYDQGTVWLLNARVAIAALFNQLQQALKTLKKPGAGKVDAELGLVAPRGRLSVRSPMM